ncbi:polycomb-like-enhancer protein [Parastagonospora nodorum]|uniref:Enhancer of polycomb-like protein n=1 Tax=Phaeosphaeria nodorum (strain SN15 / ATCC MYA-4574 / FGSC 10173) TaxID=321614 RepID=A0A7U2F9E4_PHANO|nr:polycomb-like-enhancer protein [Parastagonospora nodorum]QRD00957.1 polycomb-like-enhancer protein [Parastagonospora nodorum SN15]KAH3925247.1 polycomb-like-enhancer protein [Parastagonospora nodorum]KAH3952952.1 polycomb-like-enhancer protein [Parastagonospora nodorum]KAH3959168.1 polycomb-like-enhancer protein [Parastagonospora nodorum]
MTARIASARFRQRKLSTKQNLPIVREHEVEQLADDDASRHIPKVETGVEKGEEIEHHLQAVISAAQASSTGGKIAQLFIPTPDAVASQLQYDDLYQKVFRQPATYIRFSSTVEDTSGCPYCMTSDDAAFLKSFNQKQGKKAHCSEDEFEEIMYFFEEKTQEKQPYADVDNTPVLPFEELEADFDETISESARRFAKEVYVHWKNQRLLKGNRPLLPSLKFEKNLETDDADPYVCFRRREVRQVRKTRGRDAQVNDKLKKLRKDLEDARLLMSHVRRREVLQREQIQIDKTIFEQRAAVKEIKRKLSIKGDDEELLITQKPAPKPKRPADLERVRQNIPGMKPRDTRSDGRLVDGDLVYLEEQQTKKTEAIESFIEDNLVKHQKWNVGWVDATWRPITPPLELPAAKSDFRTVFTQSQLPTPPASVSDEGGADAMTVDRVNKQDEPRRSARIRFATPPEDVPFQDQTRFRRRIGRGGRVMIDRRGMKRQKIENGEVDERVADRWKFSGDSSEDEQIYAVDWTDTMHIRYRNMIDRQGEKQQPQQVAPNPNRRSIENHNRSASGHLMPPTPTNASAG